MGGVVADTSVWIDLLAGRDVPQLEDALVAGTVVLPPLVVAELTAGAEHPKDRLAIGELLQDLPLHETPLAHWIAVGELRRLLKRKGLLVWTPDAHIAQCALDRDALLLSRDEIFLRIAELTDLRFSSGSP